MNDAVTLVGAVTIGGLVFNRGASQTTLAAPFPVPPGMDRVILGGAPWGDTSTVGAALGVGTYQRLALYASRLLDSQVAALAACRS